MKLSLVCMAENSDTADIDVIDVPLVGILPLSRGHCVQATSVAEKAVAPFSGLTTPM